MNLTPDEAEDIAIRVAAKLQSSCHCGLSHDAQKEMGHLFGMLRDVSSNNTHSQGVEKLRDVIKAKETADKWGSWLARGIAALLLATVGGWLLVRFGEGIMLWVRNIKGTP